MSKIRRAYLVIGSVILVLSIILVILNLVPHPGERTAVSQTDSQSAALKTEDKDANLQAGDSRAALLTDSQSTVPLTENQAVNSESQVETAVATHSEGETAKADDSDDRFIHITVSAVGDCTLGMDESFDYDTGFHAAFYDMEDPGWFFENCREYFATDDLTIINFEGVLSNRGERQEKKYVFRGAPEFVEILKEGSVEAANLANNHTFDYGMDAYEDTKQILSDAGITSFGYDRSAVIMVKGIKVGMTGTLALYDEWDTKDKLVQQIEWCKDQGSQLIISSIHWGEEGEYHQEELQEYLGRAAVDAGSDLVIGHHPHRLQPYEIYKGKVILYSLGNFCFGGNSYPSDMDTAIFQQTFTFENDGSQQASLLDDLSYEIIPFSISSAEGYNNYQPEPLKGDDAERALSKISRSYSG